MPLATRESLFKPVERRYVTITLPICGQTVRIQSLREGEKAQYESEVQFSDDGERRPPRERMEISKPALVCLVLVDEKGDPLLSEDDIEAVEEMDGKDISAIYETAWVHCGFDPIDVEALVKNSAAAPVS